MEQGFWHQCWQNNTIGFHQDDVHPLLRQHFEQYIPGNNHTILVPLCGKSLDMVYLSQFGRVIGSELSELACRDFFKEQQLKPEITAESDSLTRYQVGDLSIYQGDFFTLSGKIINSPINVIYDRAALIALPKTMRQKYVDKLTQFMTNSTKLFLISLEFPAEEMDGPPFPVSQDEINTLFSNFTVTEIDQRDITGKKFAQRRFDVTTLIERAYIISKAA